MKSHFCSYSDPK